MQLRGFIFFIIDLLSPLSSLLSYFPTPSPFFLILFPAMQYTCKCYMQCAKNHLWQHCLHLHSPHTSLQQPMYSVCTSTSKLQPVHIAYIISTINYGRNSYTLLICTPSFPGKFFTLIIYLYMWKWNWYSIFRTGQMQGWRFWYPEMQVLLSLVPSYSQGRPDIEIYRGLSSVAFKCHRITLIRGHEGKTKVFVTLRKKRK